MEEIEFRGYCLKCRIKHDLSGVPEQSEKNGAWMVKGKCPKTGTVVVRMLGKNWSPE